MSQSVYCKYYQAQYGGELPVFRGGGSQSGAGIGDLLRGLGRMILPVALRGVSSLASNTLAGTQAGLSLGSAAKAAILPSLSTAVFGGSKGSSSQSGSGVLFDGENGIPTTEKAIGRYKRAIDTISGSPSPKRSRKSKKAKESGTHYNF
jgi:hypothetical protein